MLDKLTLAMNNAVTELGGIDKAIEACERMYSATFRSEAFKLSELEDWEDLEYVLKQELASSLYATVTGYTSPEQPMLGADEREWDNYCYDCEAFGEEAEEWLNNTYPEFEITGDTLVVSLCNYKGESENNSLYITHKHLPVFVSKNESFNAVN